MKRYQPSPEVLELLGVIMGDGSILYRKKLARLEISGNAHDGYPYFFNLKEIIQKNFNKEAKIRLKQDKKGRGITLYIDNKEFVERLMNEFSLPKSPKTFTIKIPEKFIEWECSKHVLRGIFESDGSLYFSKSITGSKFPTYPRIEIKTSSRELVKQLVGLLSKQQFKVQTLLSKDMRSTKIYVSGFDMLEKWIQEIGFGSEKNINKYLFWKKFGYYIPKSTPEQRETLLKVQEPSFSIWADGQAVKAVDTCLK